MPLDNEDFKVLQQIANALERIATALESVTFRPVGNDETELAVRVLDVGRGMDEV